MRNNTATLPTIPKEKFEFANIDSKLHDKKFDDKPIGYFKDAFIRFCKNKASVVAAIIIIAIILFAFLCPLFITTHDNSFMVNYYAMKPARVTWLRDTIGIADGGANRNVREAELMRLLSIGIGAADPTGEDTSLSAGMETYYQPVMKIGDISYSLGAKKEQIATYEVRVDTYLELGFIYRDIEQSELPKILEWQEQTGKQVLYPLIAENEWNTKLVSDSGAANYWYKHRGNTAKPITLNAAGNPVDVVYSEDMVLEDNYLRDADGNPVYYKYTGGGDLDTAQLKVRVLYYNYYQYLYGFEPNYIMGTENQGYDMALRIADGILLSLEIAIAVCVINFILGAIYGAIEGYYGGAVDLILERVSDILSGVQFIIVATLFQKHLAAKSGPILCLLFAYVLTGWIGTAYSVRTQFYRFKNQEYVMAARTLGARDSRIIWKHIFPNTLGTIITSSALAIPGAIMSESMLSFLGIINLGGTGGTSLGTLLSDAQSNWSRVPHLMLYPALIISLLMICFNLFGNGLRDAFNPSLRGTED